MENFLLDSKSKLTKDEKVALMLLGGDCGSPVDGVDASDGIDQDEVDIIDGVFNWLDSSGDEGEPQDGYIVVNEDGTVEVNLGSAGSANPGDHRISKEEFAQWKEANGY